MPRNLTPAHLAGPLATRRLAVLVFLVAVVALHATLFWIGHHPEPRRRVGDEHVYWDAGKTLAAGGTLLSDSLRPPLQPVVLSAVLAACGDSVLAVEVVQTLMLLAVALLLGDLTRELTGSRVAALVAGGAVLIYPPLAAFAHFLWPEVLHMLFFTSTIWILVRKAHSRSWTFGAGVCLGLALASKYLIWPFLLLALPVLFASRTLRPAVDRTAVFLAGLGLVIGLVYSTDRLQIRGYPIVESATFNVWVGLNDRSRKDLVDPEVANRYRRYIGNPSIRDRNELMREEIRSLLRQKGLSHILAAQVGRQYFRLFDKDSFLTDQLPGGVLARRNRGYREAPTAVSFSLRFTSYSLYAGFLVCAAFGVVVFPARGRRWSLYFLAFLTYAALVFLVSHVKSRFRVQLLPFFFIYSGCTVAWLASKLGWNVEEMEIWSCEPRRRSWWFAVAAAALLLFLAFGRSLV